MSLFVYEPCVMSYDRYFKYVHRSAKQIVLCVITFMSEFHLKKKDTSQNMLHDDF